MTLVSRRAFLGAPIALAALAAGCNTTPPPAPRFPQITFRHLSPLRLDVADISIQQTYQPPATPPNVEHRFPVPPGEAALQWARDRLVAAGTAGRAEYIVREASVVEVPLEPSGGLKGLMTKEQSERYDALLVVDVILYDSLGGRAGSATVKVSRGRSVPEDATLNERDQVWFSMTEAMMAELDAQLEKTIKSVFNQYVIL